MTTHLTVPVQEGVKAHWLDGNGTQVLTSIGGSGHNGPCQKNGSYTLAAVWVVGTRATLCVGGYRRLKNQGERRGSFFYAFWGCLIERCGLRFVLRGNLLMTTRDNNKTLSELVTYVGGGSCCCCCCVCIKPAMV